MVRRRPPRPLPAARPFPWRGTRRSTPVRTSPVPAVARRGSTAVDEDAFSGRGDQGAGALEQDDAAERVDRAAHGREPVRVDPGRLLADQPASSPECGVSTRGAGHSPGSSSQSASPSTTAGSFASASTRRTSAFVPSLRPRPGPIASAPAFSASSNRARSLFGHEPVAVRGSGRLTASSTRCSKTGTAGSGPASTRSRRRRGKRRARRGKARRSSRGEPPTTTTWPGRVLVALGAAPRNAGRGSIARRARARSRSARGRCPRPRRSRRETRRAST